MSKSDAKTSLNMGNAPGPAMKTALGGSLQKSNYDHEAPHRDSVKSYTGDVVDIRFPLREDADDGVVGTRVKINFDNSGLSLIYNDHWFRLTNDLVSMLHQYGTREAIMSSNLRVILKVRGISIRAAEATIVGDSKQEQAYTNFDKTAIKSWADIVTGIKGGKVPS